MTIRISGSHQPNPHDAFRRALSEVKAGEKVRRAAEEVMRQREAEQRKR